ncbi:uncharacterized protein [Ptychodera flava]|uniref:uncharacterized protein isoform X1 n=1 Tax=Ptychodera flava TaxID=63121 RepID=UPI00396A583B
MYMFTEKYGQEIHRRKLGRRSPITTLIAAGLGQGIQRAGNSSFLPLASSTPMQVKSCGQSVRNDKNMSLEEVVFDTEQYGTDDNGAAEAGDDVTNAMDVIIAKKCLAFVPAILTC